MGAMKTESPVSMKTKIPVTLCSLGRRKTTSNFFFFFNQLQVYKIQRGTRAWTFPPKSFVFSRCIDLPHSKELGLLSRGWSLGLHLQRVYVRDGDDGSGHVPGQTHERADHHEDGHPEKVQVIACPFLPKGRRRDILVLKNSVCKYCVQIWVREQCANLEFVLLPVDNHRSDLLIHKYENGDQKCRKCSSQVHPPGVPTNGGYKPAPMWTCGLKKKNKIKKSDLPL